MKLRFGVELFFRPRALFFRGAHAARVFTPAASPGAPIATLRVVEAFVPNAVLLIRCLTQAPLHSNASAVGTSRWPSSANDAARRPCLQTRTAAPGTRAAAQEFFLSILFSLYGT